MQQGVAVVRVDLVDAHLIYYDEVVDLSVVTGFEAGEREDEGIGDGKRVGGRLGVIGVWMEEMQIEGG